MALHVGAIQFVPECKRRGRDLIWLMRAVKDGSQHARRNSAI